MSESQQPSKSRTYLIISTVIGGAIGSFIANSAWRLLPDAKFDPWIVQASKQVNQTLPMRLDDYTRFDLTVPLPGKKLMYKYTLTNLTETPNPKELIDAMRPIVTNNYKTSTTMAQLRNHGVTLVYAYHDENGSELAQFEVTPNDIR